MRAAPVAQSGNERSCHRLPPAKRSGVVGPEGFLRIGVTRLEVHARDTTQRSAAAGTGSRASVSAVTREPLDQAETRRPCNRTAHCSNRWKEQSERAEPSSLRWLVRNESEAPESGGVRRHRHARIRSEASALRARRGLPLPPGSLARSLLAPGAPRARVPRTGGRSGSSPTGSSGHQTRSRTPRTLAFTAKQARGPGRVDACSWANSQVAAAPAPPDRDERFVANAIAGPELSGRLDSVESDRATAPLGPADLGHQQAGQ